jgi:hypothetical protein
VEKRSVGGKVKLTNKFGNIGGLDQHTFHTAVVIQPARGQERMRERRGAPIGQGVECEGLPIFLIEKVNIKDNSVIPPQLFSRSVRGTYEIAEDGQSKLFEMRAFENDPLEMRNDSFLGSGVKSSDLNAAEVIERR